MTYGPWGYGAPPPYYYPVPPPIINPSMNYPPMNVKGMKGSSFKAMLRDWEAWEEFQKKHRKEEKREERRQHLGFAEWFLVLCVLNSITIPAFIILALKILK